MSFSQQDEELEDLDQRIPFIFPLLITPLRKITLTWGTPLNCFNLNERFVDTRTDMIISVTILYVKNTFPGNYKVKEEELESNEHFPLWLVGGAMHHLRSCE